MNLRFEVSIQELFFGVSMSYIDKSSLESTCLNSQYV